MQRAVLLLALLIGLTAIPSGQSEKLDFAMLSRIRDEGLTHSEVMDHVSWLSDVFGPRLTGGPGIMQAGDWVLKKFAEWGLANAHRETWNFGRGWSLVRFSAHMIQPQVQPIIGVPVSWSPSTKGTVTAGVVRVQIDSDGDFDRYRGKLAGKIVLGQPAREVRLLDGPIVLRMTPKDFEEAATVPIADARPGGRGRRGRGGTEDRFRDRVRQFYISEGVVALFDRGSDTVMSAGGSDLSWQQQRTDGGTVFPSSGDGRDETAGTGVPAVTLAVEHYNRLVRILDKGLPVTVELSLETKFYEESAPNGFNLVAEIPGTDPALKDEVVMIGAHFDSVGTGTGATDNATGSAAMMEAMRILEAIGARPRRTIRIALWGGEEEGLLGSRAYVREHFGDAATMALKPDHAKLSAYFNSDNEPDASAGSGCRATWLSGRSSSSGSNRSRIWVSSLSARGLFHRRITSRSTPSASRVSSSWWIASSTTRARTIRTWTFTIGCSAKT
jgi:carboxypeptidase Q